MVEYRNITLAACMLELQTRHQQATTGPREVSQVNSQVSTGDARGGEQQAQKGDMQGSFFFCKSQKGGTSLTQLCSCPKHITTTTTSALVLAAPHCCTGLHTPQTQTYPYMRTTALKPSRQHACSCLCSCKFAI